MPAQWEDNGNALIKGFEETLKPTHQKKSPILVCPSNTRTPVGVKPRLYSLPSLACREHMKRKVEKETKQ